MSGVQQNTWVIPTGGYLLIHSDVLDTFSTYKQEDNESLEAGGILLGNRRGPHIELLKITKPQTTDIRRRHSFDRSSIRHSDIAITEWKDSNGYIDYLGEWHTHPEENPQPSQIDITEMSLIASSRKSNLMLSVIVGTEHLWVGAYQEKCLIKLTPFYG